MALATGSAQAQAPLRLDDPALGQRLKTTDTETFSVERQDTEDQTPYGLSFSPTTDLIQSLSIHDLQPSEGIDIDIG